MTSNSDAKEAILENVVSRAPAGLTIPPKSIRDLVEKTAGYVARNGLHFEDRIRREQANVRMEFMQPDHPYHPYYRWRVDDCKAGGGNAIAAGRENEVSFSGKEAKGPEEPPAFLFSARMPRMSAQDLEVVRLTALYVAKKGRSWMTQLSQREAANPQFDFLRPQHTFHQYFSRLVDQYSDLLNGDSVDDGRPQKKRIVELEDNVKNRQHVLERAKKRAEWVRYKEAQKAAEEEKQEQDRRAFLEIDWHDFIVVETVVFDDRDAMSELPAPTSLNDLQSASLEQKAAMSIDPSRRLEEAFPSFDDHNQFYGQQPQQSVPVQSAYPTPPQATPYQPPAEHSRMSSIQAERERIRAAQQAANTAPTLNIRPNHVPRAQAKKATQNISICPNCKQAIPVDEMTEHLRIEMLDPRWREQSKVAQHRSSTTNLSTADVANNLKRLASQRTDVFDPITGRAVVDGERDPKRQQGVSPGQVGVPSQNTTNVQEQIRQLHERHRGQ